MAKFNLHSIGNAEQEKENGGNFSEFLFVHILPNEMIKSLFFHSLLSQYWIGKADNPFKAKWRT